MYKLYLTKSQREKLKRIESDEWNVNSLIKLIKKRCPDFDDFFNDDSLNHVSKYALYLFPPLSHYGNARHKQLESYIIEREKGIISVPKNKAMFQSVLSNFKIVRSSGNKIGFENNKSQITPNHAEFFGSVFIEFVAREFIPSVEIRERYLKYFEEKGYNILSAQSVNKQMKAYFKQFHTSVFLNHPKRMNQKLIGTSRFSVNIFKFNKEDGERLQKKIKNFKESNNIK